MQSDQTTRYACGLAADAERYLYPFLMNQYKDLTPGEIILRKSSGNFRQDSFNPFEWVGGRWDLTNRRLLFESNSSNFQSRKECIYLQDITSIGLKYHDFLSSKLTIFLVNDSVIELHVKDRKQWIDDILKALNSLKAPDDKLINSGEFINTKVRDRPRGTSLQLILFFVVIGTIVALTQFLLLSISNK